MQLNKKLWTGIVNGVLICIPLWAFIIYGCASVGKFTPQGATMATDAVNVATGLLHTLDGFYDDLLTMKVVPDYTKQATRALTIADDAAKVLKKVIAGEKITNKELNAAAGMVDGAKAILKGMK